VTPSFPPNIPLRQSCHVRVLYCIECVITCEGWKTTCTVQTDIVIFWSLCLIVTGKECEEFLFSLVLFIPVDPLPSYLSFHFMEVIKGRLHTGMKTLASCVSLSLLIEFDSPTNFLITFPVSNLHSLSHNTRLDSLVSLRPNFVAAAAKFFLLPCNVIDKSKSV